jgi:multiple sugar transport system substrate-binding protein
MGKRVRAALVALCAAGALLFGGCGDDRPERDARGRTIVRFMLWGRPHELKNLRAMLREEFERENPDIHVEIVQVSGNVYQTKLATMLAAGIAPDVFAIHEAFLPTAVENELLLPLDDFVAKDPEVNLEDFFPGVVEQCRRGGRLYELPVSWSTVVLYYNEDLFDEAGLGYPDEDWTWDDLLRASKALTVRNEAGVTVQYGLEGPGGGWLFYLLFLWQNGGRLFDDEGRLIVGKPPYLERNVEAWEFLRTLAQGERVTPVVTSSTVRATEPFLAGKRGMKMSGTWFNGSIEANWRDLKKRGAEGELVRFGIAPLPRGRERATIFFGGSPVIYRHTKHPEAAWRLIRFFTTKAWQRRVAEDGRSLPARRSVAHSDVCLKRPAMPPDVDLGVILRALEYARPQPAGAAISELMEKEIRDLNERILIGQVTDIRAAILKLQRDYDLRDPRFSIEGRTAR